jgi:hypothetical protein
VRRWLWLALGVVGTTIIAAIAVVLVRHGERIAGLKHPEKLVIYSIDGTADSEANRESRFAKVEEEFATYPVLGKVEVTDQKERDEWIAVLQDAIVRHDGIAAKCFWPRHAILAIENGQTFEIVICFQCRQYMLNGRGYPLIAKRPEVKFNEYLRRHNVAIAP